MNSMPARRRAAAASLPSAPRCSRCLVLHFQDRVPPAKWVGHRLLGQWIGHPSSVNHQTVFVIARWQGGLLQPVTVSEWVHGLCFRVPVVEGARNAHSGGRRMREFKAHWHEFRVRVVAILVAAAVIMVLIVFHSGKIDWSLCAH